MSTQNHALTALEQAAGDITYSSPVEQWNDLRAKALAYANAIHDARIGLLTAKLDEIGLRLEQRNDVHGLLLLDQIQDVLDEVKEHS